MVLLRQLSYAIKNQKRPGTLDARAGLLWHKRALTSTPGEPCYQAAMVNETITKSMLCAGGVKDEDTCTVSIMLKIFIGEIRRDTVL